MQATAMMRDYRAQEMSFEIVDMNLEERSKYRRLLAGHLSHAVAAGDTPAARADLATVK
jgi:hypothetical protein